MTEFEYEMEIENHKLNLTIEVEGHCFQDHYGADADGNRGEWRTEVEIDEIKIKDARGNDITKKVEDRYESDFFAIDELATDKLYQDYEEGRRR